MSEATPARILVADDEPLFLRTTGQLLRKAGYEVVCVPDAPSALEALEKGSFNLVLSDLNMPGNLRLELLHAQRQQWPDTPLIVVTGVPSLPSAIESLRLGIADYLLKPVRFEDLLASVRRALAHRKQTPSARPATSAPAAGRYPRIIGESAPMQELKDIIDRVAGTSANILLTGESGTGKEVVAKTIHETSGRASGPFQVIDCTAIPESLFESVLFGHAKGSFTGATEDQTGLLAQSDGGTAFFDEIGELPLQLQSKLLRVVQEQTFTPLGKQTPITIDTRFICATNRNLELEVNAGRFRRDLFYRLAVIPIRLAPLRERGDDVVLLAEHFLRELGGPASGVEGFTEDALDCFRRYDWPGNVRELRNVVERALALHRSSRIDVGDLPPQLQPAALDQHRATSGGIPSREDAIESAERQYLAKLLRENAGNVAQSARQAGLSRQGLHKLLKKHGIEAEEFRE